jgi:hypothetical protein
MGNPVAVSDDEVIEEGGQMPSWLCILLWCIMVYFLPLVLFIAFIDEVIIKEGKERKKAYRQRNEKKRQAKLRLYKVA